MKKEEIKITIENCEGYCDLYKKSDFNVDELNKVQKNIVKSVIIDIIVLVLAASTGLFTANLIVTSLLVVSSFATPLIVYMKNLSNIERKHVKEIALKYPSINVNVSSSELEKALKETGILKYQYDKNGNICECYDINGYKNYAMENQKKEQTLKEDDYKVLKPNFNVSNKEDKAKVKVKTMVRK